VADKLLDAAAAMPRAQSDETNAALADAFLAAVAVGRANSVSRPRGGGAQAFESHAELFPHQATATASEPPSQPPPHPTPNMATPASGVNSHIATPASDRWRAARAQAAATLHQGATPPHVRGTTPITIVTLVPEPPPTRLGGGMLTKPAPPEPTTPPPTPQKLRANIPVYRQ
jgi:hypothetical protein